MKTISITSSHNSSFLHFKHILYWCRPFAIRNFPIPSSYTFVVLLYTRIFVTYVKKVKIEHKLIPNYRNVKRWLCFQWATDYWLGNNTLYYTRETVGFFFHFEEEKKLSNSKLLYIRHLCAIYTFSYSKIVYGKKFIF